MTPYEKLAVPFNERRKIEKTGRHFDEIEELLKKMGDEK